MMAKLEYDRPALHLAYEYILPSYEWAIDRHDAADTRMKYLQTLATSILVGVVSIATTLGSVTLASPWFLAALLSLVALFVYGRVSEHRSFIRLMNPQTLYREFLNYGELDLKDSLLKWAGRHYEINRDVVNNKERYLFWMHMFFFTEVGYLMLWLWLG